MSTPEVAAEDSHRVRSLSAADVAAILDRPRITALRTLIPQLVGDGVLRRVGRRWYGRRADIEQWALGTWTPPRGRRR